MNAETISCMIYDDLNRKPPRWHGTEVEKCMVFPKKTQFVDENNEAVELWLVFEERPETIDGYKVIYSEQDDAFGLVSGNVLIGFYGSFTETLESM